MPGEWDRVQAVFHEVADLGAEVRSARLSRLCRTDPELHREVVSLLAAEERAPDVLWPLDSPASPLCPPREEEPAAADGDRQSSDRGPATSGVPARLRARLLPRYRISREVGRGGTATVYLAHDTKHGRPVAIKVLRPEVARSVGVDRFLREIRIAAGLTHPNILPLYDSGEAEGLLYFVMPFVEGESVRERLDREGRFPVEEAVRIAREVAQGLAHAHAAGVVHRDIKPGNLLLSGGHAVIADFGIARAVSAATEQEDGGSGAPITEGGIAIGTPAYMSPEQVSGREEVSGRSDLYSLGCVLYEMLAGQRPFVASSARLVLTRHLLEDPPNLRDARPEVSDALAAVVARAMAKAPTRRFATAEEMKAALEEAGDGGRARVPGIERRAGRSPPPAARRRKPLRLSAIPGAFGALALVLAGAWGVWQWRAPPGPAPVPVALAVMPFESVGEEGSSPLIGGVQAGLLTRLSRIPELAVISEASAERLRETDRPLPEVASRFGVEWIVRGQVQQVGEQVQVHARLVNARRDRQVWAETYRVALAAGDLFEIQGEIVRQIADALAIRLTPEAARRVASVPTENTAALELYLRGEELRQLPTPTVDRLAQRMALYRRALELDPAFAEAWVRLGHGYWARSLTAEDRRPWGDSAILAARKALELNPELADAYWVLGNAFWALGHDIEQPLGAYRRALELEPSHAQAANNLKLLLARTGRLAEALRWGDMEARISPGSSSHLRSLIWYNSMLGRDDAADALLEQVQERDDRLLRTEFFVQLFHRGDVERARALIDERQRGGDEVVDIDRYRAALALYENDWKEARRQYRNVYPGRPYASSPLFQGFLHNGLGLAFALDRLGDREEARAIADEVVRATEPLLENDRFAPHLRSRMAVAHLLLGDTATALDWLERAIDMGFLNARTVRTLPVLEPLREHSRFQALLERMGLRLAEEARRAEAEGWGSPVERSRGLLDESRPPG